MVTGNKLYQHRELLERRKDQIKILALKAFQSNKYQAKDARYRSLKGIGLGRKDAVIALLLQILPLILIVLLLIMKFIF